MATSSSELDNPSFASYEQMKKETVDWLMTVRPRMLRAVPEMNLDISEESFGDPGFGNNANGGDAAFTARCSKSILRAFPATVVGGELRHVLASTSAGSRSSGTNICVIFGHNIPPKRHSD